MKKKIIRVTTVPMSLASLLKGQLNFMSDHYEIIGVSSAEEGYLEEVGRRENIRTVPVEMTRKITPLKDLIAVYKLYHIFKKEQPFIVHSHTPKAGTLSMLAALLAKVPNRLHTIAGLPLVEAKGIKRLTLNLVEKITYTCATKIYPNSYGLVDIILQNKFTTKDKLKVLGNGSSNGIDTTHFNPEMYNAEFKSKLRADLNFTENDYVFVYIGRLVKDKGVNELITAFSNIDNTYKNVKLLLVGWYENELDPLLPETEAFIKSNNNIRATGWAADVRPYFAIANTLVFPSYREGFPNVVLQACAMNLPCIVTNINGCNEIISEPENGSIIPIKNTEAIHNAMEKMYTMSKDDHKKMGTASRNIVVSKFEQQFVWNAILKEYRNLEAII
jgi:glycosyltransferase involved in cell wall biosynthesis